MATLRFKSKLSGETRTYNGTLCDGVFAADEGKVFEIDGPRVSLIGTRRDVLSGQLKEDPTLFATPIRVGDLVP